jgi:hypothetical protein
MRKWILGALAASTLMAAGTQALAQNQPVDQPWAIRLGALWPTNGTVKDATSHTWFDGGVDRIFARTSSGDDWIGSVDFGTASSVRYWILQALYKWHNKEALTQSSRFSFGFGGGVYFFDPDVGGQQNEFGIPVVVDWDLTSSLFLEGKYHWVVTDTSISAFSAQVGYRF